MVSLDSASTSSLMEMSSTELSITDASSDIAPDSDGGPLQENVMKKHVVYLPDMFSSIMAVRPVVNPNYHEVKIKADSWITRFPVLFPSWLKFN